MIHSRTDSRCTHRVPPSPSGVAAAPARGAPARRDSPYPCLRRWPPWWLPQNTKGKRQKLGWQRRRRRARLLAAVLHVQDGRLGGRLEHEGEAAEAEAAAALPALEVLRQRKVVAVDCARGAPRSAPRAAWAVGWLRASQSLAASWTLRRGSGAACTAAGCEAADAAAVQAPADQSHGHAPGQGAAMLSFPSLCVRDHARYGLCVSSDAAAGPHQGEGARRRHMSDTHRCAAAAHNLPRNRAHRRPRRTRRTAAGPRARWRRARRAARAARAPARRRRRRRRRIPPAAGWSAPAAAAPPAPARARPGLGARPGRATEAGLQRAPGSPAAARMQPLHGALARLPRCRQRAGRLPQRCWTRGRLAASSTFKTPRAVMAAPHRPVDNVGCRTCMRSRGYVASKSTRPAGASAESAQAAQTRCSSLPTTRRSFSCAACKAHPQCHKASSRACKPSSGMHACNPGGGKNECWNCTCQSLQSIAMHSTAAASEPKLG